MVVQALGQRDVQTRQTYRTPQQFICDCCGESYLGQNGVPIFVEVYGEKVKVCSSVCLTKLIDVWRPASWWRRFAARFGFTLG